ncbi:MAG: hypothetical protein WBB31_01750 [Saprospiraceae bacterium]
MKKALITFINLIVYIIAFGQNKTEKATSAIINEGKMLYKSEMASWYGTDIFLEKFSNRRENIGGYFSYTDNDVSTCIFFSKSNDSKVIGTISFDSTYNVNIAKVDGSERNFTTKELEIYTIRKIALAEITSDTLFKTYKNTNLNLIPIINKQDKKVYVLTGPQTNDVVIIGNDYLLTFDKKNNLIKKKQLHKNIMPIKYSEEKDEAITAHTHLKETGDYITATDICTLLLYEKFAKWKQHIVISEDYVSLWNCKTDQLVTLTKKAWDNINSDQQKHGKNLKRKE